MLWNPKVYCCIHKSLPPVPILSQINPVYAPHPTSRRSMLLLSSHLRLGLPSGLVLSVFPTKTLYAPLLSLIRSSYRRISKGRNIATTLHTAVLLVSRNTWNGLQLVILTEFTFTDPSLLLINIKLGSSVGWDIITYGKYGSYKHNFGCKAWRGYATWNT